LSFGFWVLSCELWVKGLMLIVKLKQMKSIILLMGCLTLGRSMQAQEPVHSMFIEYGYPGISEDTTIKAPYSMLRYINYRVYTDEHYTTLERQMENPFVQKPEQDLTLQMVFVEERNTGGVTLCVKLDSLRVRMILDPKDDKANLDELKNIL